MKKLFKQFQINAQNKLSNVQNSSAYIGYKFQLDYYRETGIIQYSQQTTKKFPSENAKCATALIQLVNDAHDVDRAIEVINNQFGSYDIKKYNDDVYYVFFVGIHSVLSRQYTKVDAVAKFLSAYSSLVESSLLDIYKNNPIMMAFANDTKNLSMYFKSHGGYNECYKSDSIDLYMQDIVKQFNLDQVVGNALAYNNNQNNDLQQQIGYIEQGVQQLQIQNNEEQKIDDNYYTALNPVQQQHTSQFTEIQVDLAGLEDNNHELQ